MTDGARPPGDPPPRRALILAAGHGTRLRPLSDRLPKPLLPVGGRSLLAIAADRLAAAGVREIAVNSHHLPEMIAAEVARLAAEHGGEVELGAGADGPRGPARPDLVHPGEPSCRFTLCHEPEILGTGGALWNAGDFLARDRAFLLHNGDVLSDLDLARLADAHRRSGALATLALVDWPRVNSVRLAADGAVADVGGRLGAPAREGDRLLTYAGLAVIDRALLDLLPAGASSLVPALMRAVAERPGAVRGLAPGGAYWSDVGTVGRYLDVHRDILGGRGPRLAHLADARGPVHADEGARVAGSARLEGWNWLGAEATVEDGAALADCVLLPGARAAAGSRHARAVLGDGWSVSEELNEAARARLLEREGWYPPDRAERVTGHGSDRGFWHLARGGRRAVLMRAPADDPELARHVAVGRFLHAAGLGGPEILAFDAGEGTVLMEDLGADTLHRLVTEGPARDDPELRRDLYRRALDLLVELQTRGTDLAPRDCPAACDRRLGRDTLRWETAYFRERFLEGWCGLTPADTAGLDEEFAALATEVRAQPVVLMHRDYQSQNILIKDGEIRLVDFQGMRRGPLAYDPMSLLRDAYVDLGDALRDDLREHYRRRLAAAGGPDLASADLLRLATLAGLQRSMQALGAFGFLAQVKGKRGFAAHIPLGLAHLRAGLAAAARLPEGPAFPRLTAVLATAAARL